MITISHEIDTDEIAMAISRNEEVFFDLLANLASLVDADRLVEDGFTGSNHHERGVAFLAEVAAKITKGDAP